MKNFERRIAFCLAFALTIAFAGSVLGQSTVRGTWQAEYREKQPDSLQISFKAADSKGDHNFGSTIKFERTQGLSPQQLAGPLSAVSFSIPSDAGTIDLRGTFEKNRGKGDFTFVSDPNFSARVADLGFEEIDSEKLFASAVLNVKLDTVSELRNSGIKIDEYEDIFKATIFKIDANYITEMGQAGFANLDLEDLVKGRIFKIDAAYAREVNSMGFGDQSMESLVKLRIFKITPEFLSEMKQQGFVGLDPDQLVQLRIFKIDAEFIQEMKASGYANPTVDELVQLKIRGRID